MKTPIVAIAVITAVLVLTVAIVVSQNKKGTSTKNQNTAQVDRYTFQSVVEGLSNGTISAEDNCREIRDQLKSVGERFKGTSEAPGSFWMGTFLQDSRYLTLHAFDDQLFAAQVLDDGAAHQIFFFDQALMDAYDAAPLLKDDN